MITHLLTSTIVLVVLLLAARLLPLTARTRHALLLVGVAKFAVPDSAVVRLLRLAGLDLERVGRDVVPSAFRVFGAGPATPAPAPTPSINWLAVLWLAVAALLLLRWTLLRVRTVHAFAAGAAPASPRERALLQETMRALHIRTAIDLLRSSVLEAPAVMRVIRPVIALPPHGLDDLTDEEARSVLLHECAHVARRDNLIATFEAIAAALLWFHPLIHYALRQTAAAREEACDEVAADGARPETYLAALTKICRAAIAPRTAGAVCMATPYIKRRVEHLMNYDHLKRSAFSHRAVLLATVVTALLVTPLTTTLATETGTPDLYSITGAVQHARGRYVTVTSTITNTGSGKVVTSPRVNLSLGTPATVTSGDGPNDLKMSILIGTDGSGTLTLDVTRDGQLVQHTVLPVTMTEPKTPAAGDPISLQLKDADLADVMKTFGMLTKKNVSIAPGVEGRISIDVINVPLEQALEIIARQNGLEITVDGENISVNRKQ